MDGAAFGVLGLAWFKQTHNYSFEVANAHYERGERILFSARLRPVLANPAWWKHANTDPYERVFYMVDAMIVDSQGRQVTAGEMVTLNSHSGKFQGKALQRLIEVYPQGTCDLSRGGWLWVKMKVSSFSDISGETPHWEGQTTVALPPIKLKTP